MNNKMRIILGVVEETLPDTNKQYILIVDGKAKDSYRYRGTALIGLGGELDKKVEPTVIEE